MEEGTEKIDLKVKDALNQVILQDGVRRVAEEMT